MSDDTEVALIAEQLRHAIDLLRGEINDLAQTQQHAQALDNHRLAALEDARRDHEERIRTLTDGVTTFKVWAGLASGSSGLISLAAFLRAFFGG